MKYKCCACRHEFAAADAIDGFRQGFHKGFLCPACGAQIDAPLGRSRATGIAGDSRVILIAAIAVTAWLAKWDASIPLGQMRIPLWMAAAAVTLVTALWFAIMHPDLAFRPTLETRLLGPGLRTSPIKHEASGSEPAMPNAEVATSVQPPSTVADRIGLLVFGAMFGFFAIRDVAWSGEFGSIFWASAIAAALPIGLAAFGSNELMRSLVRRR